MKEMYQALKKRQQKEFSEFPFFAAFSNEQFADGMRKLGVTDESELYRGVGGVFYRKTDASKLHEMMRRFDDELKEAYKDDAFLYDAMFYELANHEYCITLDSEDALEALNLTVDEVTANERLLRIFSKASRDYLNGVKSA